MSDLNWCPVCDKAIHESLSTLYCSDECLQYDALNRNPLLGYDFAEFKSFLATPTKARRRIAPTNRPPPLLHSTTDDEEDESPVLTPKSALAEDQHSKSPPKFELPKSSCHYCDQQLKHPPFSHT
ncbi:hypothetical protein BJV82DRAFT_593290 [Fennellomyces sp. T-0311]|nr:hypothetical protein BJV82DRAFT_593290 [Fennellomyces sp. T-0311]